MSTNYVQVVDPATDGNPSCHVCGAVMTETLKMVSGKGIRYWTCMSCGETTEPTEPARDGN